MNNLRDLHVLVLGLGASGLAMVRWCAQHGAVVTVVDSRAAPPQLATLLQELPAVTFVHSDFNAALVEGTPIRAVFKSPGLSPAETAGVMDAAQALGLWVGGELSLFAQALKDLAQSAVPTLHALYSPKVLAITGTNGKTTVTALTAHLVRWAGKSVAMAGNIGPTLLDTLAKALAENALPEVWVLELSSFQLDLPSGLEPTAAVVLNLTQDHLDWHGSMAAYARAKSHIFGSTGLMLLNREDPGVMAMRPQPIRAKLQRPVEREYVSFGTDMPQRPGDFGIEDRNGMVWLVRALEADETRKKKRRVAGSSEAATAPSAYVAVYDDDELYLQRFMPADALRIRGRHNASNALAALALCSAAGCALGPILFGLREYRGEPHRVESLGLLNGVEYFDDSKGTNVGATVAALSGLGAERKLVLLVGGEGKGQDFAPLAAPIARYVRAVVLFGRDAPLIRAAIAATAVPLLDASSMDDAVVLASRAAQAGDAVLLSPACASFDMFKDYAHRAQCFVDAVRALALDSGSDLEALV